MYRACARRDRGFTLIELMVVVSIIGILASIAVPNMLRSRMAANEAAAIGTLRAYSEAQSIYKRTDWDKDGFMEYANLPNELYLHWDWMTGTSESLDLVDKSIARSYRWGWGPGWANQSVPKAGYWLSDCNYYANLITSSGNYNSPDSFAWKTPWLWGFRKNGQWWDGLVRHGACAYPQTYNMTGMNIYIINDRGEVYQKDGYWEYEEFGDFYGYWYQYDNNMLTDGWTSVQ